MSTAVERTTTLSLDSPAFVPLSQQQSEEAPAPNVAVEDEEEPPPFDQLSGEWEWTPDAVGVWEERGLNPKYHATKDGSFYVWANKSVPLMNKAWREQEAESFLMGIQDMEDPNGQDGPGQWGPGAPPMSEDDIAAQEEIEAYLSSMSLGGQDGNVDQGGYLMPDGYGDGGGPDAGWGYGMMNMPYGMYMGHNGMVGAPGESGGRRDMMYGQYPPAHEQHYSGHHQPRGGGHHRSGGRGGGRGGHHHHGHGHHHGGDRGDGKAQVLSHELTDFVASLMLSAQESRTLALALRKSGMSSLSELQEKRWTLTSSLGIDIALASIVSAGLSRYA
eukprot:CAMPEP_0181305862 /NCGR_PEP_ID=MMETSP1101-20121128/9970_1 /TAXON_ID=46948 /ORGANISM="Rhodomonas abbreviata, Strain Caron Lab Isolate" /LENGTH=330 /DNA_ID=CAMNT_0023411835 /DNA_START=60 /DNA_END=1052 /DNA_ORIENTATION=+